MWSRRVVLGAAALPLALLVAGEDPGPASEPRPGAERPAVREPAAAPRPEIVGRAEWRADESLVREPATYTGRPRAVFVHQTSHPNDYACADVPALLRAVHHDHVEHRGWDDLGYNFLVDRCGTVYEGRAGGVARPVRGAHIKGFNADSTGIGAIGSFGSGSRVPQAMLDAVAALAAWKLRPGTDPDGQVRLVSTHDASRYPKGTAVSLPAVSGHRDGFHTRCPGEELYRRLPEIRAAASALRSTATTAAEREEGPGRG